MLENGSEILFLYDLINEKYEEETSLKKNVSYIFV